MKEADLLKSFKKTIRVLKKITNKKINIVNIKGSKTFKNSLNKQENHKFSYYVIGGSVWPKSGLISEYEIQCVNKFGRKYSIGSNISKLEENFEIEYMKKIISLFDKFIVRDAFSYELSSKVSKTKIMLLADPVYSLYDQNQEINKKGGQLSVSLTYPDNSFQMEFSLENLFNTFKEEIINLKISNKITQINFISFQDKKDLDVINQFIKFSGQELFDGITTKIIKYKGNIDNIIKSYSDSEYSLATRFHSIVLSNIFFCNTFVWDYDNKNINHINDLGFEPLKWYKIEKKTLENLKKVIQSPNINPNINFCSIKLCKITIGTMLIFK